MIRAGQLYVSHSILAQLRAIAELDGMECAEVVAELALSEYLAKRPEIEDRVKMIAAAKKQAERAWAAKWKKKPNALAQQHAEKDPTK